MNKNKKITQETIAQHLNYSRNTVSKVFNGNGGVKERTRQRILSKAAELGYKHPLLEDEPNDELLGVSEKNDTIHLEIAFVCHANSFGNSFWMPIIQNMERHLSQNHCTMRFVIVEPENEQSLILPSTLTIKPLDGIVIAGLFQDEYYKKVASLNIPLVSFDISRDLSGNNKICDVVMVENTAASYQLTQHLISQGHTKIAFVGNRDSCQSFYERWDGYHRAMNENSLTRNNELLLNFKSSNKHFDTAGFYQQLLEIDELPTAFVCANDNIAKYAYQLQAPPYNLYKKMTVCGFDNTPELTSYISNHSTARIFADELGQALGEQILWRIKNPNHQFRCLRLCVSVILK